MTVRTIAGNAASAAVALFLLAALRCQPLPNPEYRTDKRNDRHMLGSSTTPSSPWLAARRHNQRCPGCVGSASHSIAVPFPILSVDQSSAITNNGTLSLSGGAGSGTNRGAAMLGNINGNTLTNAAGATINTTGAFNDGMAANGSGNTLINNGTIRPPAPMHMA